MAETITIKKVYNELKKIEKSMVTKKEIESLKDTIEIMGNPDTIRQIADSMQDIKQGKVKEVNSVNFAISDDVDCSPLTENHDI